MAIIDILGTIAATLTTISFFPQAAKVLKTRHTKDISLPMYVIFITGVLFWFIYGVMLGQWPIIIANIITLLPTSLILFIKIRNK